jgi:hypothetical protein
MRGRSRHVPHDLIMETLAALKLSEELGTEVRVSLPPTPPFRVRYDPTIETLGYYECASSRIVVKTPVGHPQTLETVEHELLHRLQFSSLRGLRKRIAGDYPLFDLREYSLPHAARVLEYQPNVLSDADRVLRALAWMPKKPTARQVTAAVRYEIAHRLHDMPEALHDRYFRDVINEVIRRMPRVRRNPDKNLAKRMDDILVTLEAIRDDADYTERMGKQLLRSNIAQRRAVQQQIENARSAANARWARALEAASDEADRSRRMIRQLQGLLDNERALRAERDVAIYGLEQALADAKKERAAPIVQRVPLGGETTTEERRRREELMRRKSKKKKKW